MKKGEATAFIIIGLIIVALVVTLFFARNTVFFRNLAKETEKTITVPEQAKTVKAYVESCIKETADKGIDMISTQGGYISLPSDPIPQGPANLFSNSLDIFNTGTSAVPYWYYQAANGVDKVQIPDLRTIQKQIESFIDNNIIDCLDGFKRFREEGYEITIGTPSTRASIQDTNVDLQVMFPVSVALKDFSFKFDKFSVTTERSLGRLYNAARSAFAAENEKLFLEGYTLDTMAIYDKIPFSGIDFECTPKSWRRGEVIENIKKALATNIPAIRIKGSKYTLGSDFDKYFVVDAKDSYSTTSVQFRYSTLWPLAIDILGEDGEILRGKPFASESAAARFLTPLFCISEYHFVYDMKFPVLVTFYDAKTSDIFQFATQVIIDNNQPRENIISIPAFDTPSEVCTHATTQLKVFALGYKPDGSTEPLDNVRVSYQCLDTTCDIGDTRFDGSDYSLTDLFPPCFNGMLIGEKNGYAPATTPVSTNEEGTVSITLEPLHELEAKVFTANDAGETMQLQPTEQAIFTFTNKDNGYTTTYISGSKTISLPAGSYEISVSTTVQSSGMVIPSKTIKSCVNTPKKGVLGILGLTEKKCSEYKTEDIKLDQALVGSADINWAIDRGALANAKKINLYAPRGKVPQTLEELTAAGKKAQTARAIRPPELES